MGSCTVVDMSTNRTEAIEDQRGRPVYVGEGAVNQDGNLKLYRCTTCGDEVVWAKSSRTGRRYLVNVSRGYNDQRFYMKRNAHDCEARVAELDAAAAAARYDADVHAWTDRMAEAQARFRTGEITQDELLAVVEAAPVR